MSHDLVRLVREWFPVFLTIVDLVVQWEELRQRDELVRQAATRLRMLLRPGRSPEVPSTETTETPEAETPTTPTTLESSE